MAVYNTEQRRKLLAFFSKHPDEQFTVRQIVERLGDEKISQSAVYRNFVALEEGGMLRRSVKDGSREIFYQYIDLDACKNCVHWTCVRCGHTAHADHAAVEQLRKTLMQEDGFRLDAGKTVLYGLCRACAVTE